MERDRQGSVSVLEQPLTRRRLLTVSGGVTAAGFLAACVPGTPGTQSPTSQPSPGASAPTTGYTIPTDQVRFGFYPCCPDLNWAFHVMRAGYFSDVGIEIVPPDATQFTDPQQSTPAMQRGDQDIIVNFIQGYLQTLNTFGQDIPPIAFHDIFLGISILKAPSNPAKTAEEIMAEGKPFPQAAREAVEQLRGQEIATPAFGTVQPQQPVVYLSYGDMGYEDISITFIDDPKIVELAASGRLQYAIPLGAGIIVQLIRNGWKPLIDTRMILANDPEGEQAKQLQSLVGSTGLSAQRKFVDERHDTVLRFLSAWWRGADVITGGDTAERQALLDTVATTVNANQGLNLEGSDVLGVYENIDPFFPFDRQGEELWTNEEAPFYVPRALSTQIQALIDNGTLPDQEYDIDRFLVARTLWEEMVDLREEADGLFEQAADVAADRKPLVDQAQLHYDRRNYLDAVNFLKAALA